MNKNLNNAKKAKNDEFYTTIETIREELNHYTDKFKDKTVYCNCDDPISSNFVKYFLMNFNRLGLKRLIATGFPVLGNDCAFKLDIKSTKEYLVGTQSDLGPEDLKHILSLRYLEFCSGDVRNGKLYNPGDFESQESINLLKESDVIVTNPPFSRFRVFMRLIMENEKEFLVIGNINAITYKEIFPLIKDNKMWMGYKSGSIDYIVSESYAKENPNKVVLRDGEYILKFGNTCWFTNLDHAKRHQPFPLDLRCRYEGNEKEYPKYDNYDAINVDKVAKIPYDYKPCWYECPKSAECTYAKTEGKTDDALCEKACNGCMGIPVSYLDKHNGEYEIVKFRKGDDGKDLSVKKKSKYTRIVIRKKM